MDANDAFASLMLMIRGHKDYAEIDVLDLLGIPLTPEGELMARNTLHQIERNLRVVEVVGDALLSNMDTLSGEKLEILSNQVKFCMEATNLYLAVKQAVTGVLEDYWRWKSQQN